MTERKPSGFEIERTTGSREVLDRLFVYGTLRQGQTARSMIANSITRCVPARTSGSIYAFPMGYPGFSDVGQGSVLGEVLWLNELPATFGILDAYEGADFTRVIKQVTLPPEVGGETLWTWIYTLSDPAAVRHGTLIAHGDWVRYWTEQT